MRSINNVELYYNSPKRRLAIVGIILAIVAICIGVITLVLSLKKNKTEIPVVGNGSQIEVPISIGINGKQVTALFENNERTCYISRNILNNFLEDNSINVVENGSGSVMFGPVCLGKYRVNQILATIVNEPDVFSIGERFLEKIFEKVDVNQKEGILILSKVKEGLKDISVTDIENQVNNLGNQISDWPLKNSDNNEFGGKKNLPSNLIILIILFTGFVFAQVLRIRGGLVVSVGWFDTAMILGGATCLALYFVLRNPEISQPTLMILGYCMWGVSLIMSIIANIPNIIYIIFSIMAKIFLFYLASIGMGFLVCIVIAWLMFRIMANATS